MAKTKNNLYPWKQADSKPSYQFDFYAGNTPKTDDEEVKRKVREREKRTGVPSIDKEVKLSQTAKFINDMYEFSDDRDNAAIESVVGADAMNGMNFSRSNLNIDMNTFRLNAVRDLVKAGKVNLTKGELYALKHGYFDALEASADEFNDRTGGDQGYSKFKIHDSLSKINFSELGVDNPNDELSKDELLGELSYAIGGEQEAVKYFIDNEDDMSDRYEFDSNAGIISGVKLDEYETELKSIMSDMQNRKITPQYGSKLIKDLEAKKAKIQISEEDVQRFQSKTKIGRAIKDSQDKKSQNLLKEIENIRSNVTTSNKQKNENSVVTTQDSRLNSLISVYLNNAENILKSSKPGSIDGASQSAIDIGKSVATAAKTKFPNWINETTDLITDAIGVTDDPRKLITRKIDDLYSRKIQEEYREANGNVNEMIEPSLSESDIKSVLTKKEFEVLRSFSVFESANKLRSDNQSLTWKIGQGVYDSGQFIIDMWIGGKGVSAASRSVKAMKGAINAVRATKSVSKGIKAASDVLGSAGSAFAGAAEESIAKDLGKAAIDVFRPGVESGLKSVLTKAAKYSAKSASKGVFMTNTYNTVKGDEWQVKSTINDNGNGLSIVNRQKFSDASISDYAYEAASNSLSSIVEAGGVVRPGVKFLSSAISSIGKNSAVASGIKSSLGSSISSLFENGSLKFLHGAKNAYESFSKLWNNDVAKSLKVGGFIDEMFEEWEEFTLRGGNQSEFFEKDNLIVTAATVGIFSGGFGAIGAADYANQVSRRNSAEKNMDALLSSTYGFSGESLSKIKSLIDNTPISMLNNVVTEISSRAQESLSDLNNSVDAIKSARLIRDAAVNLNKSISKYVAHNYAVSAMRERLPKDVTQAESFLKEAFGSIENDIASRAVENVSNEDTGNVEKVFIANMQKEAFLIGGVDINVDGTISERVDDEGNPVMAKIMLPKSGQIKEIPASYILDKKISESSSKEQLISEIASFNTSASVLNSMIDPDGNARKRSTEHRRRLNIVDGSEDKNPGMKFGDGNDFMFPNIDEETGSVSMEHRRLVKDDSNGTYRWLKVDKNTDQVIDDKVNVESVDEDDTELELSRDGRKVREVTTEKPDLKIRSAIEDDEDDSDGYESDPSLYVESISDAENVINKEVIDIVASNKIEDKLIEKTNIDQPINDSAVPAAIVGDTEEVFSAASSDAFKQKYNEDVSIIDDTFESEFSFLEDLPEEEADIIINKLKREDAARKVDRVADQYTAKTLIFINKYFKGYKDDGSLNDNESDPSENSKVLLDGDWYDRAEVSISTIAIETEDFSGKPIAPTRAPLITLTNPDNPSETLMFSLKSKRRLDHMLKRGKITPIEYDRAISIQDNILKAVKSRTGINLAIGLGKPKMSSFRLGRKLDPDTKKPIRLDRRTISDTNTGTFTMDSNEFNFNFRFDGILYSFEKGGSKANIVMGVSDEGSLGFASMSMIPPVIKEAKRDYTPILGPTIDESLADIIVEIIKAPSGSLIAPIIQSLGNEYMFGSDKFINGALSQSGMTNDDFIEMFLTCGFEKSEGVFVLGENIYNLDKHAGNIRTSSADHIKRSILGGSLNINLSMFFDEQMNLLPLSETLKVSEQVASDYFGNDLHQLLYEQLATTDLDYGFYDPPFVFISERGEFDTNDIDDGGVSVEGILVENSNDIPHDILEMLNDRYNKRSRIFDQIFNSNPVSMDEAINMMNDSVDNDGPIKFKVTTDPSKATKNVMQEVVARSLIHLAKRMFNADVIYDPKEVQDKIDELQREGKLDDVDTLDGIDGFVYEGNIYLNGFSIDSYGHEMAHLLIKSIYSSLPTKDKAELDKKILEFAKTNPIEVAKLAKKYNGDHSPELEFFCNEFGSSYDKHLSNPTYTGILSTMFKFFAKVASFIYKISDSNKSMPDWYYNYAARYAFNASMSDFYFIKAINDSENTLANRCADMVKFCKKILPGPISGDAKVRNEIKSILENTIHSNLAFAPNGTKYDSNMTDFELAYMRSKTFKKMISKYGIQLNDKGHPIKLYIDQVNASIDGSVILTDKRGVNPKVSGFLLTDNVLEITNLDEIHEMLNSKNKQEELKDIYFKNHNYDAIRYKIDGRTYFILNDHSRFMTDGLTDNNVVRSVMENSDSIRRNKALSMLEDGHSIGSIIASTGYYPIGDSGNNLIKINFSNEKINMSLARKAVLTGELVDLSSLYSNEELMNLINSKNIKVRILTSDTEAISSTSYNNNIVTITVNGAVNKFDYKNIVRDAVYNIISNGTHIFDVTPFYITTNTSYNNDVKTGATGDARLKKALENRDIALDMWNEAILKSLTNNQLNSERRRIFKETGWMMNNSNSMTTSILLDYKEIVNNLKANVNGSKNRHFMLKDFIPSFVNGGRLSTTSVVFDEKYKKSKAVYDFNTNTITIGKSAFEVSDDGSIILNGSYIDGAMSAILHEASHATSMNVGNDIEFDDIENMTISNVSDINRKKDNLYLLANGKSSDYVSDRDRLFASIALDGVNSILSSGKLKSMAGSDVESFIDNVIDKHISDGIRVKGKASKKKIKTLFFKTIFSDASSREIRSIEESSAHGSEGFGPDIFLGPVFRILDNFGTSIRRDINSSYDDDSYYSILGRNGDLYFSLPDDEKPNADSASAFKSITRSIINSAIKNAKTEKDIRRIAENSVEAFKSQFNITGTSDISSIIGRHVDDLIDSLKSTVTDFYSFIRFIPYEYSGVIQVTDRAAVENIINESLASTSGDMELDGARLARSVNKLLINSDSKIDVELFSKYFKSINVSKTTSSDVFNKMSTFSKSRSYVDQKLLKENLYYIAKNSSNVNSFMEKINGMAVAKNPIAIGIVNFGTLASNMGMSNYYERLYTQFKQNNTSFLDSNAKNMTDVQLAINKNSGRKKINSIISDISVGFIKSISKEALSFSGADESGNYGENSDGIIIFLERLGIAIDKKTADIYASQYLTTSVSSAIKLWSDIILEKRSSGISSKDELGKAIDDIVFITSLSESAPIKKDGSTFPSMSKFNAITQTIDNINNMSTKEILEFIKKNKYRSASAVLEKIAETGNKIRIHKQIDSFDELEDAQYSDIMHLLSGYISLGKISTDGTRYYISGHNIFDKYFSYNYDSDVRRYYTDGSYVNKINIDKIPVFSDFFKDGSILNTGLKNRFKMYAYAEINSIIEAHSSFSLKSNGLIDGYHISKGEAGAGCKFTDYMNGIRLAAKSPDGAVYSSLNDAIDEITKYERQFLGSDEGVKSLRDQLINFTSKTHGSSDFEIEVDNHYRSGYLSTPGAFARLMIKKMILTGGIDISGLRSLILKDMEQTLLDSPKLAERLSALGDETKVINPKGAISVAYLNALISKIEASKMIFGSPSEYGSIVKMEKRTQSWNTTYSIPSIYDETGIRTNGESVPKEFANNEFTCEFGMDFEKDVVTGPYDDVSDTLGTVLISPSLYKEMLNRARGWNKEAQVAYDKLINAGKSGGDLNSVTEDVKFNPLKLIYVGEYVDDYGVTRKTMIKAQFIPLFNDKDEAFGDLYDRFTSEDPNKRIHMYAMRDSVKLGFSDKMVRQLKFENLGMISIPRDEKSEYISLIRKLLLFNDPNFHSAIESNTINNLSNLMNNMINEHGVIDAEYLKGAISDLDGVDVSAALDEIIKMQKSDPTVNPLDFVGMFDFVSNKINREIADAFDFKMKGTQCSAVTERFFTPRPLEFVNDSGTMDIMVPMEYFGDIVKGLSYNDAVDKLTRLGYIDGPMSNCMVARNPVQGHSSISPAKIVGVFPRSYGFCISAPSEFLKANGGDYDGDKYFLFSVSNEGTVESNKLMYDLLRSQRRTMEGNVDADMDSFMEANKAVEKKYPLAKNTNTQKNVQSSQYKSEVSGLGLVGVCVNMISGLLSFIKHDMSYYSDGTKITRTKKEVDESLSTVSALFSLAVDIATNPLLQDLGVSSKVFKIAFAIASVSDMETTVKFLHSNLTDIKPETDGVTNFPGLMSTKALKAIVTDALDNPRSEYTEEQQVFINTMSKFGTELITLKHSDDLYDFVRNHGYFDSVLQAIKIKESVDRITKSSPYTKGFNASNVSATGLTSASKKLEYISNVLSNSSQFMSREFIVKFFEKILKDEKSSDNEFDQDQIHLRDNSDDKVNFERFKTKVVLEKINSYVSNKIGLSIFRSFNRARINEIKNYMISNHNISFTIDKTYIHSVTASKDTLYRLGEIAEPGTTLGDFFSLYYASAAQSGMISDENKRIKEIKDSPEFLQAQNDPNNSQSVEFLRFPGKIISMKHSIKFGASRKNSNTLSNLDIKMFEMKDSLPSLYGYEKVMNMISARTPIEYTGDGNNRIEVIVNKPIPSAGGDIYDSIEKRTYNVKGKYTLQIMNSIKDLIYSIENKIPFINTTLNEQTVSAVLVAIDEYNNANRLHSNVHVASDDVSFISKIWNGRKVTSSDKISDAPSGSTIIVKNLNNIDYYELVDTGDGLTDMDVYDMASNSDYTIISINKNVFPQLGFGNIKGQFRDADDVVSLGNIQSLIDDFTGFNIINLTKSINTRSIHPNVGSFGTYNVFIEDGRIASKSVIKVNSITTGVAPNGDTYRRYNVSDMAGTVHIVDDFNGNKISAFIDLSYVNENRMSNAIIISDNASKFNINGVSNVEYYRLFQTTSEPIPYKKMNIEKDDKYNKMCTI